MVVHLLLLMEEDMVVLPVVLLILVSIPHLPPQILSLLVKTLGPFVKFVLKWVTLLLNVTTATIGYINLLILHLQLTT